MRLFLNRNRNSGFFIITLLFFSNLLSAQTVMLYDNFETNNGNSPLISGWSSVCSVPTSFNGGAPFAGTWSLYATGGNFQGCFPGIVTKEIPCAQDGDIIQISGWAKVDTSLEIGNLIGIALGTIGSNSTPTFSKFDTSSAAISWTQFSLIDTLSINSSETAIVALMPGETSSFFSCAAYFDLIIVTKTGNINGLGHPLDLTLTTNDSTLVSNDTNAVYQWIDCDNAFSIINGETNQIFSPTSNGNYAVIVSENTCIDTSACFNITSIGLGLENLEHPSVKMYPNPTNHMVNLDLDDLKDVSIEVLNSKEQIIFQTDKINSSSFQFELNQPAGIYFISINSDGFSRQLKLIKE